MTLMPTTPGSIILEGEPELYPEDGSRYMGSVWQLHDDGMWQELTDNGKHGARMGLNYFNRDVIVLYTAEPDPKPYEKLRKALADYMQMQVRTQRMEQDLAEQARLIERLQAACE